MIKYHREGDVYVLDETYVYYSTRYKKSVTIEKGSLSDGATGARDVGAKRYRKLGDKLSACFWVHDELCVTGKWDDGTKVSNFQASTVLCDILKADGYWFRGRSWWLPTFLFGGGAARDNGMFKA